MTPKVSIIIPVYNGSNFLYQAIDSAINQTYKNIEILVINDGSDDDEATEKISKSFGSIISYYYKPNGGVASALNFGIEKASGDFISWLSHDDVYLPSKIEDQLRLITDNSVVFSDFFLADQNLNIKNFSLDKKYISCIPLFLLISKQLHGCTVLAPIKLLKKFRFNETLKVTQDYDLWFRISKTYKFTFLNKKTIISRMHNSQHSRNLSKIEVEEILSLNYSLLDFLITSEEKFKFPFLFRLPTIYLILIWRLSLLGELRLSKKVFLLFVQNELLSNSLIKSFLRIFYLIFLLIIFLIGILISFVYRNLTPSLFKSIARKLFKALNL